MKSRKRIVKFAPFAMTCLALGLLSSLSVGCAPPQPKMQRDLEEMRRETNPKALADRGDAFASLGDMTRAEQYFVAAVREGGDAAALTRRLVAVCVADGRYPAALEYATEHLRKHPGSVDVRFAAATLYKALGDADFARKELARVLGTAPDFADAHYALAQLDREAGDPMAADASYRSYLRIEPTGPHADEARNNLMRSVP